MLDRLHRLVSLSYTIDSCTTTHFIFRTAQLICYYSGHDTLKSNSSPTFTITRSPGSTYGYETRASQPSRRCMVSVIRCITEDSSIVY